MTTRRRPALLDFEDEGAKRTRTSPSLSSVLPTNSPTPALPLTFGVEFEFMLATRSTLNQQSEFDVVAEIFSNVGCPAVVPPDENEEDENTKYDTWRVIADPSVNRSGDEVLTAHVNTSSGARFFDTGNGNRMSPPMTLLDWRIGSIEVTTRVLSAPAQDAPNQYTAPAMLEISRYLNALNAGNTTANSDFGVYVNQSCGLHVHVGVPQQPILGATLPLELMQHLVYIIAQFEPILDSLHPIDRRALYRTPRDSSETWLGSNLMGLRRSRHICSKVTTPELSEIQDRIFVDDMTMTGLGDIFGSSMGGQKSDLYGKWKFVSMARFYRADENAPAPGGTVEFRQHHGSLDFEEVSHWAVFVIKLVRAAERAVAQAKPASPATPESQRSPARIKRELETHLIMPFPRRQGNKYKVKCRNHLAEMHRLFNLIGLTRQEKDWWIARYADLNPEEVDRAGDEFFESVEEALCPMCAENERSIVWKENEERKRQERREQGLPSEEEFSWSDEEEDDAEE